MTSYWSARNVAAPALFRDGIVAELGAGTEGALGVEPEFVPGRHGYRTEVTAGSIGRLRETVAEGVPPILLVDVERTRGPPGGRGGR